MPYYPYYPTQPNVYPMQQSIAPTQPTQMQIQNGGFVSVRSELEARNYPVALGNSVTFKDENAPYIYTKTMGFSQLDRPTFDKYKLVKEEPAPELAEMPQNDVKTKDPINLSDYVKKAEFEPITKELGILKKELSDLKASLGEEGGKNE